MSEILPVSRQVELVRELCSTRTHVLHSEVFRLNVALTVLFGRERLRAVRTHESPFAVDHRHGCRPVDILKKK